MDKIKIRKLIYFLLIGILGINIFFLFPFQVITFFSINKKLIKLSRKLKEEKLQVSRLTKYKESLKLQKEKYQKVLNSSIREEEFSKIISIISQKAKKFGVRLCDLEPLEISEKNSFDGGECYLKPISVTAYSTFKSFMRFLRYIEKYEKFIKVKNLEILSNYSGEYPIRFLLEVFVIKFKKI